MNCSYPSRTHWWTLARRGGFIAVFCFFFQAALSSPIASTPPAPRDLISQMRQRFESLHDYQCRYDSSKIRSGQTTTDSNSYFFKKPKLIRLEVLTGKDKGAKVVLNKNGKVRARAGGILGIFTVTMEPDDKRLRDEDGAGFVETDLGTTMREIAALLEQGTATVTETQAGGRKFWRLTIDRGDKRDVVTIDPDLLLPVEWDGFIRGQAEFKTEWKDLRVNVGLPDSLFEM